MVQQIVSGLLDPVNAADLLPKQEATARKEAGRDVGKKKKRTNRSAKLKQCKLDARREQWLSQVKDKSEKIVRGGSSPLTERSSTPENLDSVRDGNEQSHDSDFKSSMNSSAISVPGNHRAGSRPDRPDTSSSSSSFSGSTGMSDDDGDASFDDWEAVADALGMDDIQKPSVDPSVDDLIGLNSTPADGRSQHKSPCFSTEVAAQGILRPEYKGKPSCFEKIRIELATTCQAWRPDDASRPPSLPTLSKQMSFPSERHHSRGSVIWGGIKINSSTPSTCPICYEDLDLTDSSFLPCSCGFRLCLFCHKKILEVDGRCPGCRKQYGPLDEDTKGVTPVTYLSRSCSMRLRI